MNNLNQCPKCLKSFARKSTLRYHLESQNQCHTKLEKRFCHICNREFCRKSYLDKHLEKHKNNPTDQSIKPLFAIKLKLKQDHESDFKMLKNQIDEQNQRISELIENQNAQQNQRISELIENQNAQQNQKIAEIAEQNQKIIQLIDKPKTPNIINNNLQIICIGNNDNYLDMLTQQWGFDRAIEYIKDCALSSLNGDCKLIQKIYIENSPDSINYIDKKKTKIQYFDQNSNQIIENKTQFGRKIANHLQNTYLKGVNYLINKNLESRGCPNKFLDDYDIQEWNSHIYNLSDEKYQRKVVNQLDIPVQ